MRWFQERSRLARMEFCQRAIFAEEGEQNVFRFDKVAA